MATVTSVYTVALTQDERFTLADVPYRRSKVTALDVFLVTRDGEELILRGTSRIDGYLIVTLDLYTDAHADAIARLTNALRPVLAGDVAAWRSLMF